jgi:hypothetical protein
MLYLYHSTTSVCAIKVRLTLDEKGLAHDGKLLDLRSGLSTYKEFPRSGHSTSKLSIMLGTTRKRPPELAAHDVPDAS